MRFWTSDLHFDHARICELADRKFNTLNHMNQTLIANWNSVVGPDDIVNVVGDIVMGTRDVSLPMLDKLNGTIHLTPGNHDYCHPAHKQKMVDKWTPRYAAHMVILDPQWSTMIGDIEFDVCHFPFASDGTKKFVTDSHGEDRYADLRPTDNGQHLICGHSHVGPELAVQDGRMVNVGVDAWNFMPVTDEQILAAIG